MLTKEQIEQNKQKFIELLREISVEGSDIDGLINHLEEIHFFTAPATSISHGNYDGGLCEHSLNVYRQLKRLVKGFASHVEVVENKTAEGIITSSEEVIVSDYSDNTIKIIGLLHDINKGSYYEKYTKNVKNDITGKWESVEAYKIKDAEYRDTFGDQSVNSFLAISRFIPLSREEVATIINFNCGMDNGYSNKDIYGIMEKYPLVVLMHTADMISSFVDKK